jgi:anthranilate phosphoribosyltransferase
LLAANGIKVAIHGLAGASAGMAPTRPVLDRFGIAPAQSIAAANAALRTHGIAYLGLEEFCPGLQRLMDLRGILGVRTAVNSAARALNPFLAPHQMQGVFHPPYRALQQETALLLGQANAIIFKGGGGEAQRNPLKPCRATLVRDGQAGEQEWPALLPDTDYRWREESLEPDLAAALWRGDITASVPEAAIVGTAAMALLLMRRATSIEAAQAMAAAMWQGRPRTRFRAAA